MHFDFRNRRYGVVTLIALAVTACCLCGCERIKGVLEKLPFKKRAPVEKAASFSDREKILRRFGNPNEKLGIGEAARSENGVRYNRKWIYYYSSRSPKMPSMRTVYFVDAKFTGSVIRQPDGTIIKEKIRFPY